ncbi:MAG TPA: hypothetical protein VLM89_03245 [Phycisphaerae bacterium]|nr:hypothetical protein [Phycisphaerae bacterium]
MPDSLQSILRDLEGREPALGLLLIGAGLIFMIVGARVFKILLIISFACVGFFLGSSLPSEPLWQVLAGIGAGIGLAVAAKFFVRAGVAVLAGGWLAAIASFIAAGLGVQSEIVLIVAGMAFLAAVSLIFVVYFEVIAGLFSLEGTFLVIGGLVVLLSNYSGMWLRIRGILLETPMLFAFLLLAGTVTGYYTQIAERQKKHVGTSG